jgi:hypothetical protein
VFVFYDDVQYDRHGWRNRNRVKTPQGSQWITIPIKSVGARWTEVPICAVEISWDRAWNKIHWETLRHNYSKAPFFSVYEPMLKEWYAMRNEKLADFTIQTTIALAHQLGIRDTAFVRSSDLHCSGTKTDRLLSILQRVGASHYISGPAAQEYLETDKLEAAGISVEWMVYDYPEYPQLYPPYDPHVSIIDLLLMTGPQAGDYITSSTSK